MPPYLQLDRKPAVLAQRGDGPTNLHDDITSGLWCPPVRIGRMASWPRHETQQLIAARIAGATKE